MGLSGKRLKFYMEGTGRGPFSLKSFSQLLHSSHVKWYTDKQSAARIVQVGSMKMELHRFAAEIYECCVENKIQLDIQWIPRTLNEKADYISKLYDYDDWQLRKNFFKRSITYGVHTRWIVLQSITMPKYRNSIPSFGIQVQQESIFLFRI